MGIVYVDAVQVGTFHPQIEGTSGNVLVDTTTVGTFDLAASGNVLLDTDVIGTYTALVTEDFEISAVPDALTIALNSEDTSLITVLSINAFNSAVTLSVSGEPTGVLTEFSDNPITPPADDEATSTLTVTVGSAVIGDYVLAVRGVSGALDHTVDIALKIVTDIPPLGDDPKTVLISQLQPGIKVFKDDKVTPATVYVVFNQPPETVRELLKTKYDAVITIGDPERDDVKTIGLIHFHDALYPLRAYIIDKPGMIAKTLMWRLMREVWRVIKETASNPGGQVKHWSIVEGQIAQDITTFKQLLLCRRVGVKLFFVDF